MPGPRVRSARLGSALLAGVLAALPLALLDRSALRLPAAGESTTAAPVMLWRLDLPAPARAEPEPQAAPRRAAARTPEDSRTRTPVTPLAQQPALQPPIGAIAEVQAPLPGEATLRPAAPTASSPGSGLTPPGHRAQAAAAAPEAASGIPRLDRATVRALERSIRSDVRQMAERSGAPLDDRRASVTEQLGQGIEASTKPECLGGGGAGLLSVFVIAYQVATDKCRTR